MRDPCIDFFTMTTPKFGKTEIVKNPLIQSQIDAAINANRQTSKQAEDSLAAFLRRFNAATPEIERYNQDAIARVGDIYSGKMAADLEGLRSSAAAARRDATDRAFRVIEAQDKSRAAALGLPGRSSFRDFTRGRLMRDAEIDAALQNAAQERADYGYLSGLGLSNLTTRQQLADSLTNREAIPATMAAQLRGLPISTLQSLIGMDQANKWYGLYKIRNNMERAADFDEENIRAIGQLQSIIKGFGPGGGGGIQSNPKPRGESPGFDNNVWSQFNQQDQMRFYGGQDYLNTSGDYGNYSGNAFGGYGGSEMEKMGGSFFGGE